MMNEKIKILWFCNVAFSENNSNATGTWLHTMAAELIKSDCVHLFNITQGKVNIPTKDKFQPISQWLMPYETLKNGLPSKSTIFEIQKIIRDINPDIIHIWGTENYWGLLSARGMIKGNIIIDIQGLKFECSRYYYSGLSLIDIIKCFGLKEIIRPKYSIVGAKYSFARWGKFEKEIISMNKNISTQSNWVRAYVRNLNPQAILFNTSIKLRKEFITGQKWEMNKCTNHQIFTSTSTILSYKGLHILIDALAILKKKYSDVRLVVAGSISGKGLRRDGYTRWLMRKITNLGLDENIIWTGPLDAQMIVTKLSQSNVAVIPSFIETYCVALDESLSLGVPTVISYSGALPELASHEKTALFYPPGDFVMCANAIETLFDNVDISKELSNNAYDANKSKQKRNIAKDQLEIYFKIMSPLMIRCPILD